MSLEKPLLQRPLPLNLTHQNNSIFHPKNISMTPKLKGERTTLIPLNDPRSPHKISHFGSNNSIGTPKNLAKPAPVLQVPTEERPRPSQISIVPSDFIFLKRKKVVHFLVAENMVRESKLLQDRKDHSLNNSILPLERSASLHIRTPLLNSPKNAGANASNGFSDTSMMTQSLYNEKKSINSVDGGNAPEIYDELVMAGDFQSKISKFNPMSPKSLLSQDGTPNNRMAKIVKKHQHRIFGMDHVNLKKVNMLLKAKNETTSSSKVLPPLLENNSALLSPKLARKNSENVVLKDYAAPDIKKEFTIFQYNPISDDFQFTEPDVQEVGSMFNSILNPQVDDLIETKPKPKPRKAKKNKTNFKSQEINISMIKSFVNAEEPQFPDIKLQKTKSEKKKQLFKRTDSMERSNANIEFKKECIPSGLGFRRTLVKQLDKPDSDFQLEIVSPRNKDEEILLNSNEKRFKALNDMCKQYSEQNKKWDTTFKKKNSKLENQSELLYKRAVYTEGEDFLEDMS